MSGPAKLAPAWAWLAYAASAAGLLVLWLLPAHKYGWMEDVDPAVAPAALEDGSGNRVVFATVVMLLAVGLQALAWLKSAPGQGTLHRVLPGLLITALLALWGLKFWR